jgi:hypothetical protein
MRTEHWLVKTSSGEEWGLIKRLIIDPVTRHITYADVIVIDTGRLVRVSWDNFEVRSNGILLSMPEGAIKLKVMGASGAGLPEAVSLEICAIKGTDE